MAMGTPGKARHKCVFRAFVNILSTRSDEIPRADAVLAMTRLWDSQKLTYKSARVLLPYLTKTLMMNGIGMTTAHLQVLRSLSPHLGGRRREGQQANKAVPSQGRNERRCRKCHVITAPPLPLPTWYSS
ncbi:hypothetical protein Landi51_01056 [Colletotrichum acutatum]